MMSTEKTKYLHVKKRTRKEIESLCYTIPKSQLKCVKDLNTRPEIVKLLEESIRENFALWHWSQQQFLGYDHKSIGNKNYNSHEGLYQIKMFLNYRFSFVQLIFLLLEIVWVFGQLLLFGWLVSLGAVFYCFFVFSLVSFFQKLMSRQINSLYVLFSLGSFFCSFFLTSWEPGDSCMICPCSMRTSIKILPHTHF